MNNWINSYEAFDELVGVQVYKTVMRCTAPSMKTAQKSGRISRANPESCPDRPGRICLKSWCGNCFTVYESASHSTGLRPEQHRDWFAHDGGQGKRTAGIEISLIDTKKQG